MIAFGETSAVGWMTGELVLTASLSPTTMLFELVCCTGKHYMLETFKVCLKFIRK
jgi:hypothetical protein